MRRVPAVATALLVVLALAGCTAQAVVLPPAEPVPAPSAATGDADPFVTGLTVPWAIGGMRIERDGRLRYFAGEWPTVPVAALRLWDTRTAWLNIEPADDRWDFARLDAFVDKAIARGTTDISLTLAGTPKWAATTVSDSDAPWLGPGSASPPRRTAEWREFVTKVATRYRGRITSYEIGNEPNLRAFWSGTPGQYGTFVRTAAEAIRAADPQAVIVAAVGLVRGRKDLDGLAPWIDAATSSFEVDAVSVHVYPKASAMDAAPTLLAGVRRHVAAGAPEEKHLWATEVNVHGGSDLSRWRQESAVLDLTESAEAAGFSRVYWYAWTDLGPEDLIQLAPGTPGAGALAAIS